MGKPLEFSHEQNLLSLVYFFYQDDGKWTEVLK